jgi:hypothetical protein
LADLGGDMFDRFAFFAEHRVPAFDDFKNHAGTIASVRHNRKQAWRNAK